jgi:spore cortex formation protein SpoVR/YcgB (stage V sporulation)
MHCLQVSGPEVAASLTQWMKNHDERRKAEVERVAERMVLQPHQFVILLMGLKMESVTTTMTSVAMPKQYRHRAFKLSTMLQLSPM